MDYDELEISEKVIFNEIDKLLVWNKDRIRIKKVVEVLNSKYGEQK